jgi:cell division protein FtsL
LKSPRPFLVLWTLAVAASTTAFVLHLALRGRTVQLGYELGRARGEQARLREVKRVLELEAASFETPQRVEVVARTLLGMQPPTADRILPMNGITVSVPKARPAGSSSPEAAGAAGAPSAVPLLFSNARPGR